VSLEEGFGLANRGYRGRGWLKVLGGHGHVIAIYPAPRSRTVDISTLQTSQQVSDLEADGDVSACPIHFDQTTWPGTMSKGD